MYPPEKEFAHIPTHNNSVGIRSFIICLKYENMYIFR